MKGRSTDVIAQIISNIPVGATTHDLISAAIKIAEVLEHQAQIRRIAFDKNRFIHLATHRGVSMPASNSGQPEPTQPFGEKAQPAAEPARKDDGSV
jgi:hypothetical protein